MSMSLIIGSRASFLARIQTFIVKQELKKKIKNIKVTTQYASTKGMRIREKHPGKIRIWNLYRLITNKLLNQKL